MAIRATLVTHVWYFMPILCVEQMHLLRMYYTCNSTHVIHMHVIHTQRRIQTGQCYFTVQITGINSECSL